MNDESIALLRSISSRRVQAASAMINPKALPFACLSYSMGGEDLVLRRAFKRLIANGEPGFYLDIGCGGAVAASNTYLFYCLGWRGLCIDACRDFDREWELMRPEDIHVVSAVGERESTAYLARHKTINGMHRILEAGADPGPGYQSQLEQVPVRRLDSLLTEHVGDRPIHFLALDVEGSEMAVLRSNNWDRWRPMKIVLECAGYDAMHPLAWDSVAFLSDQGYRVASNIDHNVFLVEARKPAVG